MIVANGSRKEHVPEEMNVGFKHDPAKKGSISRGRDRSPNPKGKGRGKREWTRILSRKTFSSTR